MMTTSARPQTVADIHRLLGAAPALSTQVPVTGLADDSRHVAPGHVFFARTGALTDGARYVDEAVRRGAVLVVSSAPLSAQVPSLQVADVPEALRTAADAWYGAPQETLDLIGITGTKGKSTVAWICAEALRACDHKPAVLGTIGHDLGDGVPEASLNTTPGVLEMRRLLARARDAGCRAAVMEVSSHALDQGRTAGLAFRGAVFTNLASDHMDYHGTPEAYFAAKARLFEGLSASGTAVLNRDDPAWSQFAGLCRGGILTYGFSPSADVRAVDVHYSLNGTSFQLVMHEEGRREVHTSLVGRHNVSNILAALASCVTLGLDPMRAAEGAAKLAVIPGRLERVAQPADMTLATDIDVFVDYAHTEDSLRQVLSFLRDVAAVPVTCVIGCGGDRDAEKRPLMARVAAELSARAVFTSDNPRTEDPDTILADMLDGLDPDQQQAAHLEVDRRSAIEHAVLTAPAGAVVLLAGKGHENYQIHGTEKKPFDDVAEAVRALKMRFAQGSRGDASWGAPQA